MSQTNDPKKKKTSSFDASVERLMRSKGDRAALRRNEPMEFKWELSDEDKAILKEAGVVTEDASN